MLQQTWQHKLHLRLCSTVCETFQLFILALVSKNAEHKLNWPQKNATKRFGVIMCDCVIFTLSTRLMFMGS